MADQHKLCCQLIEAREAEQADGAGKDAKERRQKLLQRSTLITRTLVDFLHGGMREEDLERFEKEFNK